MFRAVVIGCGAIGSLYDENRRQPDTEPFSHAGAYEAHPELELIGGVDPDSDRRTRFSMRWGKPAWSSIDEMLRTDRPDIWSLCTPASERLMTARAAVRAMARGAVCEKPIAATLSEAAEMVSLFGAARIPVIVNYSRRFDPLHQELAQRVQNGVLGRVQRVVIHYVRGVANYGSHAFDLLRFLLDDEIDWVASSAALDDVERDPSLTIVGRMVRGTWFTLLPLERAHYDVFEVDVWGTKGRCRIGHLGTDVTWYGIAGAADWDEVLLIPQPAEFPAGKIGSIRPVVSALIAAINGEPPACSLDDGLKTLAAVTAAEQSWRSGGQPVTVCDAVGRRVLLDEEA